MSSANSFDDSLLDDRMTDETKMYVKTFLTSVGARTIIHLDIKQARAMRDAHSRILNSQRSFDSLEQTEYFVNSLHDDYKIPVTAYVPKQLADNATLVVFAHGGGGSLCSRLTHHLSVAQLAEQSKCVWLSIEYRLAPEFKFPIGHNDCLSVAKWAIQNKTSLFGLNENAKVGVSGDSFGGSVGAYISQQLPSEISFQILIYPAVEMETDEPSLIEFQKDCFILIPDVMAFFNRMLYHNPENFMEEASMLRVCDYSILPKTLLIAAELDPIRDYTYVYHKKLQENGVISALHTIKGVHHGFFNIPSIMPNAFSETASYIINFLENI